MFRVSEKLRTGPSVRARHSGIVHASLARSSRGPRPRAAEDIAEPYPQAVTNACGHAHTPATANTPDPMGMGQGIRRSAACRSDALPRYCREYPANSTDGSRTQRKRHFMRFIFVYFRMRMISKSISLHRRRNVPQMNLAFVRPAAGR